MLNRELLTLGNPKTATGATGVGSMETQPLKIDIAFYSYKCGGMATGRTCPSEQNERLNISGTRLRAMFANKETVPPEFSRPEVVAVLQEYYDKASKAEC